MLIRHSLLVLVAVAALTSGSGSAPADDAYPARIVTLVVPYAAGGPTDTVARLITEPMARSFGQQIVVENVGGASGTIGAARVAKAEPDGYTLLLHTSAQATNDLLYRTLAYGSREAFEPIGVVSITPMTLVGRSDLPPSSAGEVLDYIRAHKGEVTYGNAGVGGPSHLCGMLLASRLDAPLVMVPYKGTGPALTDLLGRQIDLICDQATNTIGHIKSGKIKAYAVASRERVAALPDLPTLDEAGLEGFETTVWLGLYGPKGLPKPVVDKVVTALHAALQDPKVIERLAGLATEPAPLDRATPEGLKTAQEAEVAKWTPLIEAAGIYAD